MFMLTICGVILLVLHSIEYTLPMSLHPMEFMFHQCIVAQLMQESLSYDSDMGQYIHFCSPYGDHQNLVTILHLLHLLLHRLCFAYINKPSCNHYLLMFASHILILLRSIYARDFPTKVFVAC